MKKIFFVISTAFLIFLMVLECTGTLFDKKPPYYEEISTSSELSLKNMLTTIELLASGKKSMRTSGSENEHEAAAFISERFKSYGLKIERQEFDVNAYVNHSFEFLVNGKKKPAAFPVSMSPSTPEEGLSGMLVDAGLGRKSDLEKIDAAGKIVLVGIGEISLQEKAENVQNAGGLGFVYYGDHHRQNRYFMNSVGPGSVFVPGVTIGDTDGEAFKSRLKNGEKIEVHMNIDAGIFPFGRSQNVVATLEASPNVTNSQMLIIGAHYDSRNSSGANDNASGISLLLELARVLSVESHAVEIKFVAFGSEEILLTGSRHFVNSLSKEERKNTIGMVAIDTVGRGNTILFLLKEDGEAPDLMEAFTESASELGMDFSTSLDPNSDHISFAQSGIPSVCVSCFPYLHIHTYRDNLENIQPQTLYNAAMVTFLALSKILLENS